MKRERMNDVIDANFFVDDVVTRENELKDLRCLIYNCSQPPTSPGLLLTINQQMITEGQNLTFSFGTTATYKCPAGQVFIDGRNHHNVTCSTGNSWQPIIALYCYPVSN